MARSRSRLAWILVPIGLPVAAPGLSVCNRAKLRSNNPAATSSTSARSGFGHHQSGPQTARSCADGKDCRLKGVRPKRTC